MNQRQTCILVIARADLNPSLIPPLKVIIPAIQMTCPIKIYSSTTQQFSGDNLYQKIKYHLQHEEGNCSLTKTLTKILDQNNKNFRVCILGNQNIDWEIAMNYKRREVVIDTAGSHPKYPQISFVTKGIHRTVTQYSMVTNFLNIFAISTHMRHFFKIEMQLSIDSYLQCKCCNPPKELKNDMWVCSVCLAVYCTQKQKQNSIKICRICKAVFDCDQ